MSSLFRNTLVFVVGYVIFMIPTYLLPWLGSNSAVLNVVGAAIGHGMTPQWWAHAWCLSMLILMTWIRGDLIGKKYLPAFPLLAAIFDLTPGLSMIPLIPTALHLVAIILGLKVAAQHAEGVAIACGLCSTSRKAGILAGLMTAAAIFGSAFFVSTSKKSLSEFTEQKNGVPMTSLPTKSELPPPVTEPTLEKAIPKSSQASAPPEKVDATPINHANSGKHSAVSVKHHHVLNNPQSATQETGKVRYINLNE